nr:HVA22-like protein E isoform X7 [Ipomoea batatas]
MLISSNLRGISAIIVRVGDISGTPISSPYKSHFPVVSFSLAMSGQLKTSSYIRMSEWSREEISQMGLLKFGLLCIDFFAWPMLALAYPLCVSIRAIETGSKYHMRKLVTYWTVLSIVSLFEHTLRVMEW